MTIIKLAKLNGELIENLPSDMKAELIVFEEVIPDAIMTSLYVNDPVYKKERSEFLNYRPDLLKKIYQARGKKEKLSETEHWINVETDEKIQFIKKYPQFKELVESIIYKDENRNIIKIVPIDEYLANN